MKSVQTVSEMWRYNVMLADRSMFGVVAATLDDAIAAVKSVRPNDEIILIERDGSVNYIVDGGDVGLAM